MVPPNKLPNKLIEQVKSLLTTKTRKEIAEHLGISCSKVTGIIFRYDLYKYEKADHVFGSKNKIFVDGVFNTNVPPHFNYHTGFIEKCNTGGGRPAKTTASARINHREIISF